MIDDKMLRIMELESMDSGFAEMAEIIRNARRYLALRENGVHLADEDLTFAADESLDAAADRRLEGGV